MQKDIIDVEVVEASAASKSNAAKPNADKPTVPAGFEDIEPATETPIEPTPEPVVTIVEKDEEGGGIPAPDNPLKLRRPIIINGKVRDALNWTEDITSDQFFEADSIAHSKHVTIAITEMDNAFNFWIGGMMIVAANPEIDPKDLEQISGPDLMRVMRLGRFFTNSASDQS